MAISLTPAAADRVRHFLAERGHGVGLRLAIRKTGCSGYAYVVNYADAVEPGDKVFDSQGTFKSQITGVGSPQAMCITSSSPQYLYSSNSNDPREFDRDGQSRGCCMPLHGAKKAQHQ